MSDTTKADDLVAQAKKKAQGGSGFFSSLFNAQATKYEEASEMYVRAANLYKIAKQWEKAGASYTESAMLQVKLQVHHEAATMYIDAANCYKKSNWRTAVECLQNAVGMYTEMGKLTMAAKQIMVVGEAFENQIVDIEKAIESFEQAADYFSAEDSTSSANKALLKVAHLSAQQGLFERAYEIYEEVAKSMVDNHLLKWSSKEYFLKAALCRLASGDSVAAARKTSEFASISAGFRDSREHKLLDGLNKAVEEQDVEEFTRIVHEYDSVSTLDAWMTSILLKIKKSMDADDLL